MKVEYCCGECRHIWRAEPDRDGMPACPRCTSGPIDQEAVYRRAFELNDNYMGRDLKATIRALCEVVNLELRKLRADLDLIALCSKSDAKVVADHNRRIAALEGLALSPQVRMNDSPGAVRRTLHDLPARSACYCGALLPAAPVHTCSVCGRRLS